MGTVTAEPQPQYLTEIVSVPLPFYDYLLCLHRGRQLCIGSCKPGRLFLVFLNFFLKIFFVFLLWYFLTLLIMGNCVHCPWFLSVGPICIQECSIYLIVLPFISAPRFGGYVQSTRFKYPIGGVIFEFNVFVFTNFYAICHLKVQASSFSLCVRIRMILFLIQWCECLYIHINS